MGKNFTDQYSLLHFASGVVAYFWGVDAKLLFIGHVVFEIIENSHLGMRVINDYITLWPGGKPAPDSLLNSTGDIVYAMIGWYMANILDNLYN